MREQYGSYHKLAFLTIFLRVNNIVLIIYVLVGFRVFFKKSEESSKEKAIGKSAEVQIFRFIDGFFKKFNRIRKTLSKSTKKTKKWYIFLYLMM